MYSSSQKHTFNFFTVEFSKYFYLPSQILLSISYIKLTACTLCSNTWRQTVLKCFFLSFWLIAWFHKCHSYPSNLLITSFISYILFRCMECDLLVKLPTVNQYGEYLYFVIYDLNLANQIYVEKLQFITIPLFVTFLSVFCSFLRQIVNSDYLIHKQ